MPFEPGVEIKNLVEVRAVLKAAGTVGTDKALRQAHKEIAKFVEGKSRAAAAGGSAQQSKASSALLGKGQPLSAVLSIRNTAGVPFGIGSFIGSKQYPQFPQWLGNQYEVGEGSYIVGPTIEENLPEIQDLYTTAMRGTFAALGLEMD